MKTKRQRQGILPLMFETSERRDDVTARAGLVLVSEAIRALGIGEVIEKELRVARRESRYTEAQKVEALVVLQSAGGECVEDIRHLSSDTGFLRMAGSFPSPDTLHDFLISFHE